jgi:hypothetical protein
LNVLTHKIVHSEPDRDILEPNIARRSISCNCKSDLERNALSGLLTIFGIYCNWERPVCTFELSGSSVSWQPGPLNAAPGVTKASTSEGQLGTQNVSGVQSAGWLDIHFTVGTSCERAVPLAE